MRFEKIKKVLKSKVVRVACAAMITVSTAAAIIPNSHAAVLGIEMAQEVAMYDPSDGSFFFIANRNEADECEREFGWIQVTDESVNTGVVIPVDKSKRLTPEQALYKAKFVYMWLGESEANAVADVNKIAHYIVESPDNWFSIVGAAITTHELQCASGKYFLIYSEIEQLELRLTGTILGGRITADVKYSSAEEEVNQLYATLIANGRTSDQAMLIINEQLATIIAKYTK